MLTRRNAFVLAAFLTHPNGVHADTQVGTAPLQPMGMQTAAPQMVNQIPPMGPTIPTSPPTSPVVPATPPAPATTVSSQTSVSNTTPSPCQSPPLKPIPTIIPSKLIAGRPELQICASLPLTGGTGIIGQQLLDGMSLFFNKIKQNPKICPFSISLYTLDDIGQGYLIRRNLEKLSQSSPILLSPMLGKEVYDNLPPELRSQILFLFPPIGQLTLRGPDFNNLIFFRASYEKELAALIDCAVTKLTKRKLAIFYEASEWGESAYAFVTNYLKKYQLELVTQASYPAGTVDIKGAVQTISSKTPTPEVILCIAQSRPAYNFIRQVFNARPLIYFLGLSNLFPIQEPLKTSHGITIVTSSVVPTLDQNFEIVQEYRTDMKTYRANTPLSPFSLEGYIAAMLTCEALKKAGNQATMASLKMTIEQWPKGSFKGLSLEFDQKTRSLCQQVWVNTEQAPDSPCHSTAKG